MNVYNIINVVALFISLITFLADVFSDYILVFQYGLHGFLDWCLLTLTFAFMPSIITMVFSLHWYNCDDKLNKGNFFVHVLQLGILYRYIQLIISDWKYSKSESKCQCSEDEHNRKQGDVCLLRIFEAFLEAAPQLVLQLYIMLSFDNYSAWTFITAVSSMMSLGWAIVAYTKTQRCSRPDKKKLNLTGVILQTVWRISLISARVMSLSLAATVLSYWLILLLAVHFVHMLCWIAYQKTGFSKLIWEEYLFNFVMAFVYCFCFFNLKESKARWRMICFYTVIFCQNCGLLVIYFFYSHHSLLQVVTGVTLVFSMTIVGLVCMIVYYSCFHPTGRIKFSMKEVEAGDGKLSLSEENEVYPVRTLKKSKSICLVPRRVPSDGLNNTKSSAITSLSDPGFMSSVYSPAPQNIVASYKKRETLCSIQDLLENVSCFEDLKDDLKSNEGRQSSNSQNDDDLDQHFCFSQNEVGIPLIRTTCISEQNLTDATTVTKISDVTDSDSNVTVILAGSNGHSPLKLREDIPSSCNDDYENLYDAVTQESPPKLHRKYTLTVNEKQTTQTSSLHDYENVAPINIHRDILGIRHWKPYFDIGDHIHDYSTFKDKSKLTEVTSDYSNVREREVTLTMSMPDLNISPEENHSEKKEYSCSYMQTNPMMRFASLDNLSNYETIWVDSSEDVRSIGAGHSSLVSTINNVREAKESLSNLYYSRLTDLSRHILKQGNSDVTIENEIEENFKNKDETTNKSFVLRTPKSSGNRCKRTLSVLLEKLEVNHWNSKNPVRRQSSIQNRTAKALQAGIRVFYRPRVHTITPKRETKETLRWDQNIRIKRSPIIYPSIIREPVNAPLPAFSYTGPKINEPVNRQMDINNCTGTNIRRPLQQDSSLDSTGSGPRHSTPETSRHVPQISVLSALSSVVASPEELSKHDFTSEWNLAPDDPVGKYEPSQLSSNTDTHCGKWPCKLSV